MKFVLQAKGLEVDAWIRGHVGETVSFAICRHTQCFSDVHFELGRVQDEREAPFLRCGTRDRPAPGARPAARDRFAG